VHPGGDGATSIIEAHLTVRDGEVALGADDVDDEVWRHVSTELCN